MRPAFGLASLAVCGAFTLLEIMIAVTICALVMLLAVPSMRGAMREQELKQVFNNFDGFVQRVHVRSLTEQQDYVIVFEDQQIRAVPERLDAQAETAAEAPFAITPKTYILTRTATLVKDRPAAEWPIWKTGVCEPVIVSYEGPEGIWKAEYDPLTVHGRLIAEEPR